MKLIARSPMERLRLATGFLRFELITLLWLTRTASSSNKKERSGSIYTLLRHVNRDGCILPKLTTFGQSDEQMLRLLYGRKSNCKISALSVTHCHTQKQWHYSSLFTRGKEQIFVMRNLKSPLRVLSVTARTMQFSLDGLP